MDELIEKESSIIKSIERKTLEIIKEKKQLQESSSSFKRTLVLMRQQCELFADQLLVVSNQIINED